MKTLIFLLASFLPSALAHAGVLDGLQLQNASFDSSHPTGWEGQNPVTSSWGSLTNVTLREAGSQLTIQGNVSTAGAGPDAQFEDMRAITITVDTANWDRSLSQGIAFDDGFPSHGLSPAEADGVGTIRLANGEFSHAITCMIAVTEKPIHSYKETIQSIDCFYQEGDAGTDKDLPDFRFTFSAR